MPVPVRAVEEVSREMGESRAMPVHKPCLFASCQEPAITAIGDKDLCCDHFVGRCYEVLEQIDTERTRNSSDPMQAAALKKSVNNCLQGALEVALQPITLSNLQKARLLDIMLWAGELVHQADAHFASGCGISAAKLGIASREHASHEDHK